jgi:hypothetical protein
MKGKRLRHGPLLPGRHFTQGLIGKDMLLHLLHERLRAEKDLVAQLRPDLSSHPFPPTKRAYFSAALRRRTPKAEGSQSVCNQDGAGASLTVAR